MTKHKDSLEDLRNEIDSIDSEMHHLLLKRAGVVARIEAAKSLNAGISAYRPAREAQMMRKLAERHHGPFPYAAAEHIWREMIGNFTRMQSPYIIHIGSKAWEFLDLAHFYFGVMTPVRQYDDAHAALGAIGERSVDMAIVPLQDAGANVWWLNCGDHKQDLKVVARVPFLLAEKTLPNAFILARLELEPTGDDKTLYRVIGRVDDAPEALAKLVPQGQPIASRVANGQHHVLVVRSGFHAQEQVISPQVKCIGAYAAPCQI